MGSSYTLHNLRAEIVRKKREDQIGWRTAAKQVGIHWQMLRRIALGEQEPNYTAYRRILRWLDKQETFPWDSH